MTFAAAARDPTAIRPAVKREGPDFWPTPPCLRGLLHCILTTVVPLGVKLWEPAAGDGRLVGGLPWRPGKVWSDLYPAGPGIMALDFLKPPMPREAAGAWVVTNPPFNILGRFLDRGLALLDQGDIAGLTLLVRHDHLAAGTRAGAFGRAARIDIAAWRPRWVEGSEGNGRWSNAWVTWAPDHDGPPVTRFHRQA